jgi:hypothetical protein
VDLCRPFDVHLDQLPLAAVRKQEGYGPLVDALTDFTSQGWIVHVFPWVVGIRGMIDPRPITALLKFLRCAAETMKSGDLSDSTCLCQSILLPASSALWRALYPDTTCVR